MGKLQGWVNDVGLFLLRAMLGIVFMFHGSQKLFGLFGGSGISGMSSVLENLNVPAPTISAVLAGSAEFFGGLALVLGFGVRIAVIPMVFTMAVAIYKVHPNAFSLQNNGMEYALTLAVALVAIGLMGPGRFSLSRLFQHRRGRKAARQQQAAPAEPAG